MNSLVPRPLPRFYLAAVDEIRPGNDNYATNMGLRTAKVTYHNHVHVSGVDCQQALNVVEHYAKLCFFSCSSITARADRGGGGGGGGGYSPPRFHF